MSVVPAAVIAATWVRLEQPREEASRLAAIGALALVPALVRPRLAAAAASLVVAARVAFGFWFHPGRVGTRFATGFLDFYDVRTPFDPRVHAEMQSVVLAAVFGFVVALGLAVAARRALVAALVMALASGWPATLAGDSHSFAKGAAILAAMLVVLAGLTARRISRIALPVGVALVLAAVAASTSSAVAKGELVSWQGWDFYTAPQPPVSVSYVWDAQYGGITFPAKRTTVLEVKGPAASLYWRAAVLDSFAADRWVERPAGPGDALEPAAARDHKRWVREDVSDKALLADRLVGGSVPVAFSTQVTSLEPGLRYTAFSYAPRPTPARLSRSRPIYPRALRPFLAVWPGVELPAFGASQRVRRTNALLDAHPEIERYAPIDHVALDVGGRARSPYAAAVALELWFRSRGGFTYTNRPAVFAPAPLVGFVAQTRAGYCQYFAGAMALMLRYLGVPARVAVGFSSGTYDTSRRIWTVTDHDAHAWVEVWFRGYGWLPFDPTPAAGRPERGLLSAPYSASSPRFRGSAVGLLAPAQPTGPAQAAHRHGDVTTAPVAQGPAPSAQRGHGSLLELLALVLAAALGGLVVTKRVVRHARYLVRDPRRLAAACRRELVDFLVDQRIEAARSATLHELGELVREELTVEPDRFVAAATAARFGPPAGARAAAREARHELRLLIRRMRPRLTAVERVRGLFSLRSLGFAA